MARDIPVGNGRLLVCFDKDYVIRDLYFPHVGRENHVSGGFCRKGPCFAMLPNRLCARSPDLGPAQTDGSFPSR